MIHSLRLRLDVDRDRLRADLDRVAPTQWHPHFNTGYYTGDWSGVPLRGQPGVHVPLYSDPTRDDFADTEEMGRCEYVPELLASIPAELEAVRFLRLAAGSTIREHRDPGLSVEEGVFRLHLPVRTNDEVEFLVGGQQVVLGEGECWYLNFDLPHALVNRGTSDRVHLVVDGKVTPATRTWFEAAAVRA